jgi:sigma-B regulation protein RsbU (phosphoserine phosphatase)
MNLPDKDQIKTLLRSMVRPQSKLGKTTLWFGVLAGTVQLLRLIARSAPGSMISGWSSFLSFVFLVFLVLLGFRWVRQKLMWRLRNRLIITYVFIGVIPILLLICMALLAGYLFAGQFATYIALSDLQTDLEHLQSANNALAAQFRTLSRTDRLTPQLAAEIASASDENFRQRSVTIIEGNKSYVIRPGGRIEEAAVKLPEHVKGDFSSFTMDDGRLNLRSVRHTDAGPKPLIVISNVPVTSALLQRTASMVGAISLYPPKRAAEQSKSGKPSEQRQPGSEDGVNIDLGGSHSTVNIGELNPEGAPQNIEVGKVPQAVNSFDHQFNFWTLFDATDWQTGTQDTGALMVSTRPSLLYNVLFGRLGEKAGIFVTALAAIGIFFGCIELIALFIGARLTRSMTKSVAELYKATESVNRGDLTHRIRVTSHDQMAALEQSFNSMTTSLGKLVAEQKDKQRLENELAIAHEVQELLFPRDQSNLPTLEVHGVCRPARTVSGDYYDFIRLPDDRMVLAVGDISGKGISAALLMATVHAFVRAYSLEPELALAPMLMAGATAGGNNGGELYYPGNSGRDGDLAPGRLMTTLNYQMYRATPPEKYATMFLGCYDANAQALVYSNGGHLPPMVLSQDRRVVRLEASGTVVGLFDGMAYGESRVPMQPGDIFVAFSDGVTEPENEFGEFGEERLIELIQLHRDQPLARISEVVTTAVADWIGGAEQPDDVTLVLARAR